MKVLLQRVTQASVKVEGKVCGEIEHGLLLLCGIAEDDGSHLLRPMAEKIAQLRIFSDERGRFHHSLLEVGGGALVVPQFTLFADTRKGRRPEFFRAMKPPRAAELYEEFAEALANVGVTRVERGVFGAHMEVALINDGPVTIMLESEGQS